MLVKMKKNLGQLIAGEIYNYPKATWRAIEEKHGKMEKWGELILTVDEKKLMGLPIGPASDEVAKNAVSMQKEKKEKGQG